MSEPREVTRATMPRPKYDLATRVTAMASHEVQDRPYTRDEIEFLRLRTERYRVLCRARGLDPETFTPKSSPEHRRLYAAIIADLNTLRIRAGGRTP